MKIDMHTHCLPASHCAHHSPEEIPAIFKAKGIDAIAEEYADRHRISKLILHPRYDLYGRSAPLKRNEMMVELADAVLVIWDGVSRGADFTIRYAERTGKKIEVVTVLSVTDV